MDTIIEQALRHFTKKGIWIREQVKSYSTTFVIREIPIKTKRNYHLL